MFATRPFAEPCYSFGASLMTMTLGLARLIGQFCVAWSQTMAAVVIASGIPALLYLLMQRFLVSGLTHGAVRE